MTDNDKALILETIDLMARVFWGLDAQFSKTLWDGGLTDFLAALDELLDGAFSPGIHQIDEVKKAFDTVDELHAELNATYVRLFVNAKQGLQVSLYQSSYLADSSTRLMGASSVKMKELYRGQGLSLAKCHNEPADHLSIELEYLYFLLKNGWEDNDQAHIEEARHFINEVLNTWVDAFTQKLGEVPNPLIYAAMAEALTMLLAFLSKE